jgi:hypothetical protein
MSALPAINNDSRNVRSGGRFFDFFTSNMGTNQHRSDFLQREAVARVGCQTSPMTLTTATIAPPPGENATVTSPAEAGAQRKQRIAARKRIAANSGGEQQELSRIPWLGQHPAAGK